MQLGYQLSLQTDCFSVKKINLNSLSQAHLVGEDPVEGLFVHHHQPVQADQLQQKA